MKKEFISLNISTPPSYSGVLGDAWFIEAKKGTDKEAIKEEAKNRMQYEGEIKGAKASVILSNNLKFKSFYPESYCMGLSFEKETETEIFRYRFTIQESEIKDLEERINQKIPYSK